MAGFNKLLGAYLNSAQKRNLTWRLTEEHCRRLFEAPCHYCGAEPSQVSKYKSAQSAYVYNGIDRVKNAFGYEPDNVVTCCATCNYAKKDKTVEEFLTWVHRIANRLAAVPVTGSSSV